MGIKLYVSNLLYKGFMWNKECVQIEMNDKYSEIKRLEFQYDALDNDYLVDWFEPAVTSEGECYIILHCYLEEKK